MRDRRSNEKGSRRGGDRGRGRGGNDRGSRGRGDRGRGRGRGDRGRGRSLAGVGDADVNAGQRGPYLVPGKMLYEVTATDWVETRNGDDLLVHELKVASVYDCRPDPDAAADPKYADPDKPYRPGDRCVYTINLGNADTWARNLKTWILGLDPDISDDEIDDFAMSCYPPEIPEFDDLVDDILEGAVVIRDEDGDEIEPEDEEHAEELAEDRLRALKAWTSPIVGMLVYGETWRNSGKAWVNSRWRTPTDEELGEIGFDALEDERGSSRRRRRVADDEERSPRAGRRRDTRGRTSSTDDDPDDEPESEEEPERPSRRSRRKLDGGSRRESSSRRGSRRGSRREDDAPDHFGDDEIPY